MVEKKIFGRSSRDYVKQEPNRRRPEEMGDEELVEYIDASIRSHGKRSRVLAGEISEMTQVGLNRISNLLQKRPELRARWNIANSKNLKKGGRRSRCGLPT